MGAEADGWEAMALDSARDEARSSSRRADIWEMASSMSGDAEANYARIRAHEMLSARGAGGKPPEQTIIPEEILNGSEMDTPERERKRQVTAAGLAGAFSATAMAMSWFLSDGQAGMGSMSTGALLTVAAMAWVGRAARRSTI